MSVVTTAARRRTGWQPGGVRRPEAPRVGASRAGASRAEWILVLAILLVVGLPFLVRVLVGGALAAPDHARLLGASLAASILDQSRGILATDPPPALPPVVSPGGRPVSSRLGGHFQSLALPVARPVVPGEGETALSFFTHFGAPSTDGLWNGVGPATPDLQKALQPFQVTVELHRDRLDSDLDGDEEAELAEVQVTAAWKDGSRRRDVTMTTILGTRSRAFGEDE